MVGEDGRGMVWPDDVPAEVARQAQVRAIDGAVRKEAPSKPAAEKEAKDDAPKPRRPRKRTPLAAVPGGDGQGGGKKPAKQPRAPVAERGTQPQAGAPRPVAAPTPIARPASHGSRKKRELPPYLRVVK